MLISDEERLSGSQIEAHDLPSSWADVHGAQPPGVLVCEMFANDENVPGESVVVIVSH